ncbi:MAG: cytochrome C [Gammaproteobacteria bacterium]|nr:cytochrome C [Gammaproteobacteria bacterium]
MRRWIATMGLAASLLSPGVYASTHVELKDVEIPKTQEARQRGAATVTGVCLMCHSLKYVKYQDLLALGLTQAQVDGMRGEYPMEATLQSMTPIEIRKESYGKVPPDLSLMAVARKNGPQYIYSLWTGYYTDKDGNTDNHVFPGIKMPDMLGYSMATDDAQRKQIEETVRDTVAFLEWAADPAAETRRSIGVYVIGYLVLLTILLYLVKRRTWRRIR